MCQRGEWTSRGGCSQVIEPAAHGWELQIWNWPKIPNFENMKPWGKHQEPVEVSCQTALREAVSSPLLEALLWMEQWCFCSPGPESGVRLLFVWGIACPVGQHCLWGRSLTDGKATPQPMPASPAGGNGWQWPLSLASARCLLHSRASIWGHGSRGRTHHCSARTACLSGNEDSKRLFFCCLFFSSWWREQYQNFAGGTRSAAGRGLCWTMGNVGSLCFKQLVGRRWCVRTHTHHCWVPCKSVKTLPGLSPSVSIPRTAIPVGRCLVGQS